MDPPSPGEHGAVVGALTADTWLLGVALAKFSRVLDALADQRTADHPSRAVRDEFGQALPDLAKVRNVLEHSEDYLRGRGGQARNQELGGIQVAVTSEDLILANQPERRDQSEVPFGPNRPRRC
jgi:hypothetical protein